MTREGYIFDGQNVRLTITLVPQAETGDSKLSGCFELVPSHLFSSSYIIHRPCFVSVMIQILCYHVFTAHDYRHRRWSRRPDVVPVPDSKNLPIIIFEKASALPRFNYGITLYRFVYRRLLPVLQVNGNRLMGKAVSQECAIDSARDLTAFR